MFSSFFTAELASDIADTLTPTPAAADAAGFWDNVLTFLQKQVLPFGIRIVVVLLITIIGSKIIKKLVPTINKGMHKTKMDKSVIAFLCSLIKLGFYLLIILVDVTILGVGSASVIALLGSLGLTVGLSLQGSLSNFAGGVLILILRPFNVGDYIISNGTEGTVTAIDIFYTKLRTPDFKDIVVPNGALSNSVITNVSREKKRRLDIPASASYSADIDHVKRVLMGLVENNELVLQDEAMDVFISQYGASSVDYNLRFWVKAEDYWAAKFAVTEAIKKTFDAEGIEIPFTQMDVTIKQN